MTPKHMRVVEFVGADAWAPALRLVAFARDLVAYAAGRNEDSARRALCCAYSDVPNADARALCAAAGRSAVAAAIGAQMIPLQHATLLAARRFCHALDALAAAYRAQGITAGEYLETIVVEFGLRERLDDREQATLARLAWRAQQMDASAPAGEPFDAAAFIATLEDVAKRAHSNAVDRAGYRADRPERHALPARRPEPAGIVPRRKTHFSASSLGTFAECERRWYFRYVCAAVEDRGSSASFYGTAFHWALERFHTEFPRADQAPRDVLERKLDGYLGTSFEHHRAGFETNVEFELQRRRALRTGRRYLAWFTERFRTHPFTVIGTETEVGLELDGHRFIGYVDRLDRDDRSGNVTVVDYKTGSIPKSAERYREKVARFIDFQLPFYYFARTSAGDRVTRLALVPLKDAARDVEPIELEVVPVAAPRSYSNAPAGVIGLDELERARVKMGQLAGLLTDAPLERFAPTDDPAACAYCAYVNACRERPSRREDRFGR